MRVSAGDVMGKCAAMLVDEGIWWLVVRVKSAVKSTIWYVLVATNDISANRFSFEQWYVVL